MTLLTATLLTPTPRSVAGEIRIEKPGQQLSSKILNYEELLHSGFANSDPSTALGRDAWDVRHYSLVLTPDFNTESLSGLVAIQLTALVNGLSEIDLDLYDQLTVGSVQSSGGFLDYLHANDILRVQLPRSLQAGETITVNVDYSGSPVPTGALGFAFDTTAGGRPILATISEPFYARSWWPCKDTTTDKATVDLFATVPATMFVASSGTLAEVLDAGDTKIYHWVTDYQMTTYNVSLAATEYVGWTQNYLSPEGHLFPLEFHVFPEDEQVARYEFARVGQMIDFFSGLYGPYPFANEKYGMAELVLAGAMEHQTMTSYGDFFLTGDRFYEGIIAHELSHQWWGNLVTVENWDDLWLHEGIATFSDGLWREFIDGHDAYLAFLRQRAANCCGFIGPISPPAKLFNQTVYQKGAWMLHMLREMIGDEDFFSAMRAITANPALRFSTLRTRDFIQAFEQQIGADLDWFFDQWLYRTGRPEIRVSWTNSGTASAPSADLQIEQIQNDPEWTFPLRLRIQTPSGPVDVDTFIDQRSTPLTVALPAWPDQIDIDPDKQLLFFDAGSQQVTAAPPLLRGRSQLLPNTPNPFNPRTTLRFQLATESPARLRILDLRGRTVKTFDLGPLPAGDHEKIWDGTDDGGRAVASGNYMVRLEVRGESPPARSVTLVR